MYSLLLVYIGNTATISFLRFLQKTLKGHVGPSHFTNAQESRKLFEAASTDTGSGRFHDDLSIEEKKDYIQCFLDAVSQASWLAKQGSRC
jgi:hypothetical protein